MEKADWVKLRRGEAALFSTISPLGKEHNEDGVAVIEVEDKTVLAVADGMGGMPLAASAAEVALEALAKSLRSAEGKVRNAILNGFECANKAVLALGQGAGTTLSVVEVGKASIRPYHAGDSLILLLGQRGKVKWQTVSHSPVGYALEAGTLDESEALKDPELNIISNMIGSDEMRIELGPEVLLSPRDTLVLASDGLSDNFLIEEIAERTRKGKIEQSANKLIGDCRERMLDTGGGHPSKPDDLSFILYRPR